MRLVVFSVLCLLFLAGCESQPGWQERTTDYESEHVYIATSPAFEVDAMYGSMQGPAQNHYFNLPIKTGWDVGWLTGYTVRVVPANHNQAADESLVTPELDAYLCHTNMDVDLEGYHKRFGVTSDRSLQTPRLFTVTQGQMGLDFPAGFGIPLRQRDNLSINTQLLNLNNPEADTSVAHAVVLNYDVLPERRMKPLFQQSIMVLPAIAATSEEVNNAPAGIASCARIPAIDRNRVSRNGVEHTGHWQVPPGLDTLRTDVTDMLALPFATTLHAAGVHVHPYCQSLTLWNTTDSTVIFHANVESKQHEKGLERIEQLVSEAGIPMEPGKRYELECITNNPGPEPTDMMAVMLLYLYDSELDAILQQQ